MKKILFIYINENKRKEIRKKNKRKKKEKRRISEKKRKQNWIGE